MRSGKEIRALVERGRLAEAGRYLSEAADEAFADPDMQRARAELARREMRFAAAAEAYRTLLDSYPDPGDAEILGALLTHLGRNREALEVYRAWTRRYRDRPELWRGMADAAEALDDDETAIDALRNAVDLDADAGQAWYRLTMQRDYEWIHGRRERLLSPASDGRTLEDRYCKEFAAGRYLEWRERWDEAFERLNRANELRRRRGRIDIRKKIEAACMVMRDWASQDWSNAPPGHPSGAPIFIVGMPRTGTSLVEQILDSHPEVCGIGEQPFLHKRVTDELRANRLPVSKIDWRVAAARYLDDVRDLAGNSKRFTDKMLFNFSTVGFIRRMFPGASIIYCRRDPLDTCISCFRTAFNPNFPAYGLRQLGWFHAYCDGMMTFWKEQFPGSVVEVSYETMVDSPEPEIRRLLDALNLPWADACAKFHENRRMVDTASRFQVRRPVYTSAIGRAAPYQGKLEELEAGLSEARDWMGRGRTG